MDKIFAIIVGFFVLTTLISPWVNSSRITRLQRELDNLKKRLEQTTTITEQAEQSDTIQGYAPEAAAPITPPIIPASPSDDIKKPPSSNKNINFEQQFGTRLPVWIGGIALALAGFFMVKYSIETGLLSPSVRVIVGTLFGIGLLYTANHIRTKSSLANGTQIAQALSGAGIADLYICIFAATSLYDLIPPFAGFAGMAAVTATAVILSLRHGMPIALMGLIGGMLTPAMVSAQTPQAPILFIYLYLVIAGLLVVIRKQYWWLMTVPTILGALVWVCVWLYGAYFTSGDSLYLGLFLIAVSATVVKTLRPQYDQDNPDRDRLMITTSALHYLTLSGTTILTGIIAAHAGFGLMEWGLFYIISLGGIGLSFFNPRLYGLVPWISMTVNAVMLIAWDTAGDSNALATTLCLFAALYIASGYRLQSRSEKPLAWAGLTAAASIGYYLLGYYQLHQTSLVSDIPLFWGSLALVFAGASLYALRDISRHVPTDHCRKQHLLAIYATTGTAFLSIAMTVELQREFLSVAFAAQLLALSWINTKIDVRALRYIVGILGCVFACLLFPQILLMIQLTAYSLVGTQLALQDSIPIVNWPAFQLGLPALFFITASYLLRWQKDDRLVHTLEAAAIALIGVTGYYLTRHAFHIHDNILFIKAGFIERGVLTNILFVYGLACLTLGHHYKRQAISLSGFVLSGVALFRIIYFDFITSNPLWSGQAVGDRPIFNALLLAYGLPILWTWRVTLALPQIGKAAWAKYGYGFIFLLSFALISLNVRQIFHGTNLAEHYTDKAEIYTYSVAWLLFGIFLLFMGTLRKDKTIRIASLAVMILTVGKVFLYDASELDGLFRVFSFLGLGMSLLGLSWFYTRFVFGNRASDSGGISH